MKVQNITTSDSWCLSNNGYDLYSEEVDRITSVTPSERQLKFMEMEYYNFIHFGINTFYDREWGNGKENIRRFNPKKLDTDQWCQVLKSTGSKGIIITAKHHDGFCLFDSKHTDHTVMNTPFGKDIVKLLSESCKKFDLKLGIYLSPWDRHESTYGSEEYNDYFCRQLTELCTNYGDIFAFWFDGACGEGTNGKKQVYDWDRYYAIIRELQPNAVISICGPDVRWIGNEGGRVRAKEYCVVPSNKVSAEKTAEISQQSEDEGEKLAELSDTQEDLGSRELLSQYSELGFRPAEADVSINPGWFYHSNWYYRFKKKRTAEDLAKIYFDSVGGNASMLLNVPPNKDGLISDREIETLNKFTRLITEPFTNPVNDCTFTMVKADGKGRRVEGSDFFFENDETGISVAFPDVRQVSTLSLKEDLRFSQRVEEFRIYARSETDGRYYEIYCGGVIGQRKIVRLKKSVATREIIIVPTQSRKNPMLCDIEIFA